MNFVSFRDWIFERLTWPLISRKWVVKRVNFKESENKYVRDFWGLMVPDGEGGGVIYLDKNKGTPKVLIHELCHAVFGDILDDEARDKNKTKKGIEKWSEYQTLMFEDCFYECLSVKQKFLLKTFIDRAKIDHVRNL